jgi:succinate dehydrogenase/fumarate reductase-like Fe-S protein
MEDVIRVALRREDPRSGQGPQYRTYEIRTDRDMTVLEILREIHCRLDPSLAYRRYKCGRRLCRSCEVSLDGKIVRGCATLLHPGKTYRLDPAYPETLIRDLVFDFDPLSEKGSFSLRPK